MNEYEIEYMKAQLAQLKARANEIAAIQHAAVNSKLGYYWTRVSQEIDLALDALDYIL